jgi:hypothetical protein
METPFGDMTTRKKREEPTEYYVVPARRFSGSKDEVLQQIDELVEGLIGLRRLVSLHGPKPAAAPKPKLQLVKRFVTALFTF